MVFLPSKRKIEGFRISGRFGYLNLWIGWTRSSLAHERIQIWFEYLATGFVRFSHSSLGSVWLLTLSWPIYAPEDGLKVNFAKVNYNSIAEFVGLDWPFTKLDWDRNVRTASFPHSHPRLQVYRRRHGYHADSIWPAAWAKDGGDEIPFPLSGKMILSIQWKLLTTIDLQSPGGWIWLWI